MVKWFFEGMNENVSAFMNDSHFYVCVQLK